MPPPNDAPCLPAGVMLTRIASGQHVPSQPLVDLFLQARNNYDWPAGTGAANSQQTIINLENTVQNHLRNLTPARAQSIAVAVSQWAGNNANSHANIVAATIAQKNQMQAAIDNIVNLGQAATGIDMLCSLPGISLVIASKIFRFCSPSSGAAVDRHASYFFNSLQTNGTGNITHFIREWSNGRHTTSRLAIYNPASYTRNRDEYFSSYLPTLCSIAIAMNAIPEFYTCAARNNQINWKPADVEMAAYFWWASHGAR